MVGDNGDLSLIEAVKMLVERERERDYLLRQYERDGMPTVGYDFDNFNEHSIKCEINIMNRYPLGNPQEENQKLSFTVDDLKQLQEKRIGLLKEFQSGAITLEEFTKEEQQLVIGA